MSWIETYNVEKFQITEPSHLDVRIDDIAHSLSMIPRFNGHSRHPWSVGMHCILGAKHFIRAGRPRLALGFLLHDATEAYLNDICKPVKHLPEMRAYRELEAKIEKVVEQRFSLDKLRPIERQQIKQMDCSMLMTEAYYLMPGQGKDYVILNHDQEPDDKIKSMTNIYGPKDFRERRWSVVKKMFLSTFFRLKGVLDE